jgi:phosphate transport system substrate-binding protein
VTYPGEVAIIVSQDNPVMELSLKEVVKIFKQEKQYWAAGKKIYLIMQETGTPEKIIVMKKVFEMEDKALKEYWLGKLFRQEVASFPKTLSSNEAVKRFVSQAPNAIGFIDAALVDERIKVLRINGKLPGEDGYALVNGS